MNVRPVLNWLQYAFANVAIVVLVLLLALQGMPPIDWAWVWIKPLVKTSGPEAHDDEAAPPEDEDNLPTPVADWLATNLSPVANATGVATSPWTMFAPNPDNNNHRLRATIEYCDGRAIQWRSPDWPQLSCWQRFWNSRELEFIDKIAYNAPSERWFAYADYLAAQNRENLLPEGAPKRVTFVLEEATIGNPNIDGWLPMSQPIPRSREIVITPKRVYPVPP